MKLAKKILDIHKNQSQQKSTLARCWDTASHQCSVFTGLHASRLTRAALGRPELKKSVRSMSLFRWVFAMMHPALRARVALCKWGCLFSLLVCPFVQACPPPYFPPPGSVGPKSDTLMVVTHASSTYDARFATKRGLDGATRFARENNIPRVYLIDETPPQHYFFQDCDPDHWVASQDGEINFPVTASRVYVAGGHLELCLSRSLHDITYQWAAQPPRDRTITFFMDAIYSNGKSVDPSDPFYSDFQRFMGVVTYGRPGGEHWPKLNLLEMMGIIIQESHELDFLQKVLPHWQRTFPESYRVELKLNQSPSRVLQQGEGFQPPRLVFHFVDSAIQ
jgi:hypothetical protein